MDAAFACIAGEEVHRLRESGRFEGDIIAARQTPFGPSEEMVLVSDSTTPYYLLPRYGLAPRKRPAVAINSRANVYALKDLGVAAIIDVAPTSAITHTHSVGDMDLCGDLLDRTYIRGKTFFEQSPLGFLRQFPVFCPRLGRIATEALSELGVTFHTGATAAVMEGPRLEMPAEVRAMARHGVDTVAHSFVPEIYLSRELEMCYHAMGYIVNYAETGSRYRPFKPGALFGGLEHNVDQQRLDRTLDQLATVVGKIADGIASAAPCECEKAQASNIADYDYPADWRQWFTDSATD